eukprot:GHVR01118967.1.p1 GENE.GHVR01118967.1~~GHVR01118967.1.p1  ORF type:complete len:150 (-),score=39.26 GHVR01118967.1:63-482(-)
MKCAGMHRELGCHISKVKSFTLDNWDTYNIKKVSAIGNKVSNHYYEHKYPRTLPRPTYNDNEGMKDFIKSKYERLSYAPRHKEPPSVLFDKGQDPRLSVERRRSSGKHSSNSPRKDEHKHTHTHTHTQRQTNTYLRQYQ